MEDLRGAVILAAKKWDRNRDKKTNVPYVNNQLWRFKNDIKKNDVFIVYSKSRIFGIAEVNDDPEYVFNDSGLLSFAHQIKVRYRWYKQWPIKADQRIIETLGKQGTLKLIEEPWLWNYLLKKLP